MNLTQLKRCLDSCKQITPNCCKFPNKSAWISNHSKNFSNSAKNARLTNCQLKTPTINSKAIEINAIHTFQHINFNGDVKEFEFLTNSTLWIVATTQFVCASIMFARRVYCFKIFYLSFICWFSTINNACFTLDEPATCRLKCVSVGGIEKFNSKIEINNLWCEMAWKLNKIPWKWFKHFSKRKIVCMLIMFYESIICKLKIASNRYTNWELSTICITTGDYRVLRALYVVGGAWVSYASSQYWRWLRVICAGKKLIFTLCIVCCNCVYFPLRNSQFKCT